ncbi:uncharacterized protein LOC112576123 isoform X2 [Pomacea canaliculata]|nr:uncharacterized protein LOC112576123 isoform X2 [Pomacea canaliculata]
MYAETDKQEDNQADGCTAAASENCSPCDGPVATAMGHLSVNFWEKMRILSWSTLAVATPKTLTSSLGLLIVVLLVTAQIALVLLIPFISVSGRAERILDVMSALLSVTLPLLGVMIASHPFSTLLTCAVQTYFIVEESVMKKWSPEAYILFFTFICLLFITRRLSVRGLLNRGVSLKRHHIKFATQEAVH